jgi:hypothetical protein
VRENREEKERRGRKERREKRKKRKGEGVRVEDSDKGEKEDEWDTRPIVRGLEKMM